MESDDEGILAKILIPEGAAGIEVISRVTTKSDAPDTGTDFARYLA